MGKRSMYLTTEADDTASTTLLALGTDRLASLCRGAGCDLVAVDTALSLFRELSGSFGGASTEAQPRFASELTDDCTPFEFSLAMDSGVPELRFRVEAQGDVPSLGGKWAAGRALSERLAVRHGANLRRFACLEHLFSPSPTCERFAMWHEVCLRRGPEPEFRIYLNPQAKGPVAARAIVEAALRRLGLGPACAYLPRLGMEDEYCFFSLSLSGGSAAKVKLYTTHPYATAARIEAAVASASGYVAGEVRHFCEAMAGSAGPYLSRPVMTCLSFVEGCQRPTSGSIHVPVRAYAQNDGVVRARLLDYLEPENAAVYRRALAGFSARRLECGVGMQTSVALRIMDGRQRVSVSFSPEAYDVRQPAMNHLATPGAWTEAEHLLFDAI